MPEVPHNDASIPDETELWRWIKPEHWNPEANCPSSMAFQNSTGSNHTAMSVLLAKIVDASGRTHQEVLTGDLDGYGLVAFSAGFCRQQGQGIVPDRLDDEPAHALVYGDKGRSVRRRFAREAAKRVLARPGPVEH